MAGLYTDADAAARVFVFDLRRRRIETELPGSDAIWLSDDLIVAVDHSATRVLLHRRTHGGWVSRPSYQPEREGVALLLVEESAGRVVMFERGPPNRLLVAHHQGDMVGWVPQPTQLERTPQLISLAGDVAVRLGRDDVTVRGLADAEPFARMVGARSYTSMTLSPDGRRLALVEHAQAADPDDVLLEPRARGSMQGEPTLHVIDLRRREHFVWGRSPATEVTFEVADTEQANR